MIPIEADRERLEGRGEMRSWFKAKSEEVQEIEKYLSELDCSSFYFACELQGTEGLKENCREGTREHYAGQVTEELDEIPGKLDEGFPFAEGEHATEGAREWFRHDPESPWKKYAPCPESDYE